MRRRQFMSLLGGAALAPLTACGARADQPDSCGIPVARDDGWPVASANVDKLIDRDALCRMADRLGSSSNVHAVLVARGGKLAFERYFKGDDQVSGRFYGSRVANVTFDADTLHDIKSASKSVASLAMGVAIDRGLIRSVDEPIFSFFPELSDLRTPEKDRILLSHALTMTMGLRWVEAIPSNKDDNDESPMHLAPDQCRYVLGLPVVAPSGERSLCCRDDTTGNTHECVSSSSRKNILLSEIRKQHYNFSHPALTKGALRGRHETWCGTRWTYPHCQTCNVVRTVKPCGPDSPTLESSLPISSR